MKFSWAIPAVDESLSVLDGLFRVISVQQEWRRNLLLTVYVSPRSCQYCADAMLHFTPQLHSSYHEVSLHKFVVFQRAYPCLEARKTNVLFFFFSGRTISSWAVCCTSGTEAVKVVVIVLWMGNARWWQWDVGCLSQRSQHWRVAVTGKSWSHSSVKAWSQPIYWWSHFRDMLQQ